MFAMKRLGRWLFSLVAAVSVLLLALTIGVSIHALPLSLQQWGDMQLGTRYSLRARRGDVLLQLESGFNGKLPKSGTFTLPPSASDFDFAGLHHFQSVMTVKWNATPITGAVEEYGVSVAWLICLFSILPTTWLVRWGKHHAHRLPGHCRTCGYDLRATPERCPECGTVVTSDQM
jgi:hypothetical protein